MGSARVIGGVINALLAPFVGKTTPRLEALTVNVRKDILETEKNVMKTNAEIGRVIPAHALS